jgi:hypothetical protein
VNRQSLWLWALAAGLILLGALWLQLDRDRSERALAHESAAVLAVSDQKRITYPAGSFPEIALPGGERRAVRSLLKVPRRLQHGEFAWDNPATATGKLWVRIDLSQQLLSVFRGTDEIGTAVILYGAPSKPTPQGRFTVIAKATDHYSRSYDAPMPFMLRLTDDGVAIHASQVRADGATHGCLGVPMRFAQLLYSVASLGDEIYVVADDKPSADEPDAAKTA